MVVLNKLIFIGCLLTLSTRYTNGQRCNGGVECINLADCTGLYTQLQHGASAQLTRLLRGLHCGFNGDQPMFVNMGFPWLSFQQPTRRPKPRKHRKKKPVTPRPLVHTSLRKPSSQSAVSSVLDNQSITRNLTKKIKAQPPVKPEARAPEESKNTKEEICCPPEFQTSSFQSNISPTTSSPNRNGWNGGSTNTNDNSSGGGSNSGRNGDSNSNGNSRNGGSTSSDASSLLPDRKTCGIQNNDRIVGGTRADLDEHPWMALLRYDKPYGWGFYCGGVLISSRYVLTAAHCVKGQDLPTNWRLSQVRLGEWNTTSSRDCVMDDCADPVQDIEVEERIAHEGYDPRGNHQHDDIALLRLAQPVQFNDFVKPICLPLTKDLRNNGFDGYNMEVAGWGKTQTRSESDVKLKVDVPVVSRSECSRVFNTQGREIINKQLCAGGVSGKDSCRGDSGGALMGRIPSANNWFAFGVVSYGPSPCGYPGWPGVYTRVGAYVDWILSKLRP